MLIIWHYFVISVAIEPIYLKILWRQLLHQEHPVGIQVEELIFSIWKQQYTNDWHRKMKC